MEHVSQRAGSKASLEQRVLQIRKGPKVSVAPDALPDNTLTTTKYTWVTFLPLNLSEQLRKFGNCYFLCISLLMYLGEKTRLFVGTIKAFSTIGTLLAMMCVTAAVALYDDLRRGQADREINGKRASFAKVEDGSKPWKDIKVGNVLKVHKGDEIPADMVLLGAADPDGTCYVSTANLDGESNLKLKSAPKLTQDQLFRDGEQSMNVGELSCSITAQAPTHKINEFNGSINDGTFSDGAAIPLTIANLLLRGTVLRIASYVVGVVVYTGPHTKMVLNSRPSPLKQSNLERVTNRIMLVVLLAQGFLALISMVLYMINKDNFLEYTYLYAPNIILPSPIGYWLTFFVLYSNLMPISLYPSMEVCNSVQAWYIRKDGNMGNPIVRSSNLCAELGQVTHIFTDKTGTLTQNEMTVKKFHVLDGDITYGTLGDGVQNFNEGDRVQRDREASDSLNEFMEVITLAHNAAMSTSDTGETNFEAESPDEVALVKAMDDLGWKFRGRKGDSAEVQVEGGNDPGRKEYKVHAVNPFTSERARMSILVQRRRADGIFEAEYYLFVKGADNVILSLAADSESEKRRKLQARCDAFGKEGLRTLVIARRRLQEAEAKTWIKEYRDAELNLERREQLLLEAATRIEAQLQLMGATAIEDKLQEEVSDTVENIKKAEIKLWMLTGDKKETARNIALLSKVLTKAENESIVQLDRDADLDRRLQELEERVEDKPKEPGGPETPRVAAIVTGEALLDLQVNKERWKRFGIAAYKTPVMIACRISPLQKATLVSIISSGDPSGGRSDRTRPVTLAIGDGANDVPMIQEAQVGIGIAGREGRQAVNNSDFAIGEFKTLWQLLIVHGRWNYRRISKFTLFTFWRNAVQVLLIFAYTLVSGYSGTSLFEDWIRLSFNFLCSLPITVVGCVDADVEETTAMRKPELYRVGRGGLDLNGMKICHTLLSALAHAAILVGVTGAAFPGMDVFGAGDYYTFGTAVFSCVIIDMNYRVLFLSYGRWHTYLIISVVVSLGAYCLYLCVYPCQQTVADMLEPRMFMVPWHMVRVPMFWLCCVAVPVLAMSLDVFISTFMVAWKFDETTREVYRVRWKECNPRQASPAVSDNEQTALMDSTDSSNPRHYCDQYCDIDPDTRSIKPKQPGIYNQWIGACLVFAAVFVLLPVWYLVIRDSESVVQVRFHYWGENTNFVGLQGDPRGTRDEEKIHKEDDCRDNCLAGKDCVFNWTVPTKMQNPILVYYAMEPFYQNYNDYLSSQVFSEITGGPYSEGKRASHCEQEAVRRQEDNNRSLHPCGMKANSFFTDRFRIDRFRTEGPGRAIKIDDSDIAWWSDKLQAKNPSDTGSYPSDTMWLSERYPEIIDKDEGVTNEHFLVWMRPAATPRLWKTYGWIHEDLEVNDILRITISCKYKVPEKVYKHLVLTERGHFGGRHELFGEIVLIGAIICLIFAFIVVFVFEKIPPSMRSAEGAPAEEN